MGDSHWPYTSIDAVASRIELVPQSAPASETQPLHFSAQTVQSYADAEVYGAREKASDERSTAGERCAVGAAVGPREKCEARRNRILVSRVSSVLSRFAQRSDEGLNRCWEL